MIGNRNRTSLCGPVGNDAFGNHLTNIIKRSGIMTHNYEIKDTVRQGCAWGIIFNTIFLTQEF